MEIADEERESLISSLELANGMKEIFEANLRRTEEELKAREVECDCLQKRMKMMREIESKKQEQRDAEMDDVQDLRKEINTARDTRMDLEADRSLAKQEIKMSSERELKLSRALESLKGRAAELSRELAVSQENERRMKELIENVQPSLKAAAEREEEMKLLLSARDIPSVLQRNKELIETIEKYAAERNNLEDKLGRMRHDRDLLMHRVKQLEGQVTKLKATQISGQQSTVPFDRVRVVSLRL